MLSLAIPTFDPANDLHGKLADAAQRAEAIAAGLDLTGMRFVRARGAVRAALAAAAVAPDIDRLVRELLGDAPAVAVDPSLDGAVEVVAFEEEELEEDEAIEPEDPDDKPD